MKEPESGVCIQATLRYTDMGPNDGTERVRMEDADLVQVDVLDGKFIVAIFSNGETAKIASSKIRDLAVKEAAEIAPSTEE